MTPQERKKLELKVAAKQELKRRKLEKLNSERTVFGFVCPKSKEIKFCLQDVEGNKHFKKVDKEATVTVPLIFKKVFEAINKGLPYITILGGRNSAKSTAVNSIITAFSKDYKEKVACFREHMNSIEESTYASVVEEVDKKQYSDFDITQNKIKNLKNGSAFLFKGLSKNLNSLKSILGITLSFVDEAQGMSNKSLEFLKKTIIRNEGACQIYVGNPESSDDAISKEFITPHLAEIERDGYFMNDRKLVLWCNYSDNPWHTNQAEEERKEDFEKLPRPVYDWMWLGKFLDTVENSIIKPEWFDACVDFHKNPKFAKIMKPKGGIICAHDVSDLGDDPKGVAVRHGSIITRVEEKLDGEISDGAEWAIDISNEVGADTFVFDASGMGVGIRKDVNAAFKGTKVTIEEFWGGGTPHNPDEVYESSGKNNEKTNKQIFKNLRAQTMWMLRERCKKTHDALTNGTYYSPDELISFDSDGIESMDTVRSELCRQPRKIVPNGMIQMLDKAEMRKLKIKSPNLLDSIAMTMITPTLEVVFEDYEDDWGASYV